MEIYKENNKTKVFPLIFITNLHHNKIINDIKKQALYVELTFLILKKLCCFIYISKKKRLELKSAVELLVDFCEKDMRNYFISFKMSIKILKTN